MENVVMWYDKNAECHEYLWKVGLLLSSSMGDSYRWGVLKDYWLSGSGRKQQAKIVI